MYSGSVQVRIVDEPRLKNINQRNCRAIVKGSEPQLD